MRRYFLALLSGLVFCLLLSAFANADGHWPDEYTVSNNAEPAQLDPSIAIGSSSGMVAYSAGAFAAGTFDIWAAVVVGATVPDFTVNENLEGDQVTPAVALTTASDFAFVWASDQSGDWNIVRRRFDNLGNALDSDTIVNTHTTGDQTAPVIASDQNDNFVVIWMSAGQDGDGEGIYGQRFDSSGNAQGGEFRVNTTTAGDQIDPAVAMDAAGDFVVVWQSLGQDGNVFAQRYNAAGVAQGGEFQVNSSDGASSHPQVAIVAGTGAFIVAWDESSAEAPARAYAQRFTAAGVVNGSVIPVNFYNYIDVEVESIVCDADGDFWVIWRVDNPEHTQGLGIYCRLYFANGTAPMPEFVVNTWTFDDQRSAAAYMSPSADLFVVWQSTQAPPASLIVGRLFTELCFKTAQCDDYNDCTDDHCDLDHTFCYTTNNDDPCDNGNWCDGEDQCVSGNCGPGGEPRCPDDNLWCNGAELCDEGGQECYHAYDEENPRCGDDGNWCTGAELCDEALDQCVSEYDFSSNPRCPDDGEYCNGVEYCDSASQACVSPGSPCDPWEECNEDTNSCEPADDDVDDDVDDDADDDVDDDVDDDTDDDVDDDALPPPGDDDDENLPDDDAGDELVGKDQGGCGC